MYTILVTEEHKLRTTSKERIMQRSKLVDSLQFLVAETYNDINMRDCECVLEYLRPVSKKYKTEILSCTDSSHDGYLQYKLPLDTDLTAEAGTVELQLTFSFVQMDENGSINTFIRKTSIGYLDIIPIAAWSDLVPDEALTSLDQRIIALQSIANQLEDSQNESYQYLEEKISKKADDITYKNNTIQLMSDNQGIGTSHVLDQQSEFDIIEFGKSEGSDSSDESDSDDTFIEF